MSNFAYKTIENDAALIDWISTEPRAFSVAQMTSDTELQHVYAKKLERYVAAGILEHFGDRRGWYRKRDSDLVPMDLENVIVNPVDIWLPFELSDLVELYPGNLVIIAGAKSSGKSALVLNTIYQNDSRWDISYFNSEMGPEELRKRLDLFRHRSISQWNFKAYSRANNFSDVIRPGPSNLNIIDFLEVHDEFYTIGRELKKIHDRLKGAIAIVCLQKNPGQEVGLGGWRSMEVTRLALSVDFDRVKITEAKNPRRDDIHPRGLYRTFKIVNGSDIKTTSKWYRQEEKGE